MRIEELGESSCALAAQLWESDGLTRPWNDPFEDFLDAVRGSTSGVLGAFEQEELIGTVMVGYDGHRGWVYYLAVTEDERRRGVGRDLMTAGEKWLHERGARKVQLMVRRTNSVVLGFYERLGYEDAQTVVLAKWLEKK